MEKATRRRGPDKKPRKKSGRKPPKSPGRPPGVSEPLPRGAVAAIKSMRWRVPDEVPEAIAVHADAAFGRIVDVMHERVRARGALAVLGAARVVREEVCGRVAQQHSHGGSVTLVVETGVPRPPGDTPGE